MGWTESPRFFYTALETAKNVADTLITANAQVPVHPLKMYCIPPTNCNPKNWKDHPVDFRKDFISQLEVYMDDFIAMSQCTSSTQPNHISRRLIHAVHYVFPPPSISKYRDIDLISIKNQNEERHFGNSVRLFLVGCLMVLREQLLSRRRNSI